LAWASGGPARATRGATGATSQSKPSKQEEERILFRIDRCNLIKGGLTCI
jgi:hypothetical protein